MKILVFGASGFIGRNLVVALSKDHEVYSAARKPLDDPRSCVVDLLDPQTITKALKDIKPEVIINTAGIVSNTEDHAQNIIFTKNILEAIVEVGLRPKRIIISGSAGEYGEVDSLPISEDAPLKADSGYRLSKKQEVAFALESGAKHDLPIVIARIFNPIGPGMPDKFIIPTLLQQLDAIQSGAQTSLEVNRLDSVRDYIDVRDLSDALRLLVENEPQQQIYNIGSGRATAVRELIEILLENSKINARPQVVEKAGEPEPLVAGQADMTRLQQEFGWRPKYSLSDTVKDILHATNK